MREPQVYRPVNIQEQSRVDTSVEVQLKRQEIREGKQLENKENFRSYMSGSSYKFSLKS